MIDNSRTRITTIPSQLSVEQLEARHNGYKGWETYTLRDAMTNTCVAVVGQEDRATQKYSKEVAERLMLAYNHYDEMRKALVEAESALFYALTERIGEDVTERQCNETLIAIRSTLSMLYVQEQAFLKGGDAKSSQ